MRRARFGNATPRSSSGKEQYLALLRSARQDPNIVGLILTGSRAAGPVTRFSDYDVRVIVKDRVVNRYTRRFPRRSSGLDVAVGGERGFAGHAALGSPMEWDGYAFAHAKVLLDRSGRIARLSKEKGRVPRALLRKYVSRNLDGYINAVYRSLKAHRDRNLLASHLEASQSLPLLLNVLFGVEGRRTPYAKYLEWELAMFPLLRLPLSKTVFLRRFHQVLSTGGPGAQRALFVAVERSLRRSGFGGVFDGWGASDLAFLRKSR